MEAARIASGVKQGYGIDLYLLRVNRNVYIQHKQHSIGQIIKRQSYPKNAIAVV